MKRRSRLIIYLAIMLTHQCKGQLEMLQKLEAEYLELSNIGSSQLFYSAPEYAFTEPEYFPPPVEEYDFIIVGSGSSGSVLANRLSEMHDWRILLLECGDEPTLMNEFPAMSPALQFSNYSWKYLMEEQENVGLGLVDRRMAWPRGRGLGGTTLINYMIHVRGNKIDYDRWAALDNPGWSYEDVLPYFKKLEDANIAIQDSQMRGHGGPMTVEDIQYRSKVTNTFVQAAQEQGYKYVDYNGKTQMGVSFVQGTVRNGRRCSVEKAYLRPIKHRSNLRILTQARVFRVLINPDTKEAYGVEYVRKRQLFTAKAKKEVILSAGTFNSPQLLMLSGVGPKGHLKELGIPLIQNLCVGETLYDHLGFAGITFVLNDTSTTIHAFDLIEPTNVLQFFKSGGGPIGTIGGVEALAYFKTNVSQDVEPDYPDVEFIFLGGTMHIDEGWLYRHSFRLTDAVYNTVWKPIEGKSAWTIIPMLVHPKSKGSLRLKSKNPFHWPQLYGNYFTDPENHDIKTFIAAIREIQRIASADAFKKYDSKILEISIPGCEEHAFDSDGYWECALRYVTPTLHHQIATCKMGPDCDPEAVVDSRARVHGVKKLRVVDSSIIPIPLTAHTNIPAIMIGENVADMIKEDWADSLQETECIEVY